MPRAITLHPFSVLAGIALAVVVFLSMSQALLQKPRIEFGPLPKDYVQVHQGTSFTVPAGKVFVPTAVGVASGPWGNGRMLVNGTQVALSGAGSWSNGSMAWIPDGLFFPAGSVVQAERLGGAGAPDGQAWGYLAEEHSPSGIDLPVVRLPFAPAARDFVMIPPVPGYVVPPGKILVLTAANEVSVPVSIDGAIVYTSSDYYSASDHPSSVSRIPPGCSAHAGSVVSVPSGSQAWGYVADQ